MAPTNPSNQEQDTPASTPHFAYGDLGTVRASHGTIANVEVAMDATAFVRLVDVFLAKDTLGYRAMADGDQTMFLLPIGTPVKVLVPPADCGAVAENRGCYVRVLEGTYTGYAGWIFNECFERTGPDDAPFPPALEEY